LAQSCPVKVVRTIFQESDVDVSLDLDGANWRGTPPLTTKPSRVAAERICLIGDAGGYFEPFTGEGMASALETGVAVGAFAARAASKWAPSLAIGWARLHRQLVYDRQFTCRQLAWVLRHRWAAFAAISLCRVFPSIAGRVIAKTTASNNLLDFHEMAAT
jgi:flavin-dependent dehydrogenase